MRRRDRWTLPFTAGILAFLNEAIQPRDLVYQKPPPPNPEMPHDGDAGPAEHVQ